MAALCSTSLSQKQFQPFWRNIREIPVAFSSEFQRPLKRCGIKANVCRAIKERTEKIDADPVILEEKSENTPDEVTKKWGLEAGLWNIFSSKKGDEDKKNNAGELLKKYGSAYLITSISLSIVSFAICYELVSIGVDVNALLQKVGISSDNSEAIGTFALAYAAHKAASPIRFPPTVALTPIVAGLLGKEEQTSEKED